MWHQVTSLLLIARKRAELILIVKQKVIKSQKNMYTTWETLIEPFSSLYQGGVKC